MRPLRLALFVVLLCALLPAGRARSQTSGVQTLFLGDRTCPDSPSGCTLAGVLAAYPYLHVVIHDEPHTYQWQIFAGTDCDHLVKVAADGEIPGSGYLEVVVNLQDLTFGTAGCYVLRGDEGFSTTFYAAYTDGSSTPDSTSVYPGYTTLQGRPDLPDLDVASIAREPALPYDSSPNQPRVGQRVRFRATIVNSGALTALPFSYRWTVDGRPLPVRTEDQTLAPGASVVLSWTWVWDPAPHTLSLSVYPGEDEISSANDSLSIRTDALALGFWVEQSAYDYFRTHQWAYCTQFPCSGSDSFEDWLQRQVTTWNGLFASARDSELAPAGVVDRVRVQKIVVVPDGSLPLHGFAATNEPDGSDHSVDLEWGMPSAGIDRQMKLEQDGGFNVDWALIHELGHARYLGDLYRFDMPLGRDVNVAVTAADGQPAFSTSNPLDSSRPLVAFHGERSSLFLYRNQEQDMMSCDCNHFYSSYDAAVLNRIQGRRARCGNANPPCNLGEWFGEIPPANRLAIVTPAGAPVPDRTVVKLFFDASTVYNGHAFDDSHSLVLQTRRGAVDLSGNPFRIEGPAQLGHNLLLIDVLLNGADSFCFQEPTDFNVAYWEGYRDLATPAVYQLTVQQHPGNACRLQRPPARVNEPFATSPYASAVKLSPVGKILRARVKLVDGADPPHPMQNRRLVFRDRAGNVIARATTGRNGVATVRLPVSDPPAALLDQTDESLAIPMRRSPAARTSVQPQ